jgi:hypothetical protein
MATTRLRHGAIWLVVALLAGTSLMLSVPRSQEVQAQEAAKGGVKKWEYLELVNNEKGQCSYSTAKEAIGAGSWKEMAEKLRVPLKDGDKVGNARLLVFDHLGGQGWELVSHGVMVLNPGYGETFLFKRQVPGA